MQTTVLDVNSYVYADGIPYTTTSNTIAACHITLIHTQQYTGKYA